MKAMHGLLRAVLSLALALIASQAPAAMPDWRPVPGADNLELALDSVDMQGSRVAALLRAPADAIRLAREVRLKAAARVVLLADFDCAARTVQALASVTYGKGDRLLSSTGAPGAPMPLKDGDPLLAAYDALCDLARERR
jgi:hypothetical protein